MAQGTVATERLRCVVVTPERAVLDEPAEFVAVPMYDGELGILPGRLPLIGRLGFGELRLVRGHQVRRYYIDGGFTQVRENIVTILTAKAIAAEDIPVVAARQALQVPAHPAANMAGSAETQHRLQERARAQLRIAQKAHEGAGH